MTQCRIDQLRVGQRVDLEGDLIADPDVAAADGVTINPETGDDFSEHPEWQFEFERVHTIEREGEDCIAVYFESGFGCGFPPDHLVDIDGEQKPDDMGEALGDKARVSAES